jgi:hypothetical protein
VPSGPVTSRRRGPKSCSTVNTNRRNRQQWRSASIISAINDSVTVGLRTRTDTLQRSHRSPPRVAPHETAILPFSPSKRPGLTCTRLADQPSSHHYLQRWRFTPKCCCTRSLSACAAHDIIVSNVKLSLAGDGSVWFWHLSSPFRRRLRRPQIHEADADHPRATFLRRAQINGLPSRSGRVGAEASETVACRREM